MVTVAAENAAEQPAPNDQAAERGFVAPATARLRRGGSRGEGSVLPGFGAGGLLGGILGGDDD